MANRINSKNSKTSDLHRIILNLTDKTNLKISDKYVALSNDSIYYTWKNIKKSYKNIKFELSAPTWNEKFGLPDELYFESDIQDYFQYILNVHGEKTNNLFIRIHVNKIESYSKFNQNIISNILTSEIMELLGSTKSEITKDKNDKIATYFEITEVV